MYRLLRNPSVLFLVCSPILLAGCHQRPLAVSVAVQQPVRNHALVDAEVMARVKTAMQFPVPAVEAEACVVDLSVPEIPKPKDELLVASVQKEPECLTGQFADGLMLAFKSLTDRH
jgi:hypothetical protein